MRFVIGRPKKTLIERLCEKALIAESGCIEYQGRVGKSGYAAMCVRISGRPLHTNAHRVSAHVFLGLDLSDQKQQANHTCDNRICINPSHIYIGDQKQNVQDCHERKRNADVRGEKNPQSKLDDKSVRMIREVVAAGKRGIKTQIAKDLGVSNTLICKIACGKLWGELR